MQKNEIEILRAVSMSLDDSENRNPSDDTPILVVSYQYHTEKNEPGENPEDPDGKKNNRAKSRYRMIGFVDTVRNIKAKIENLKTDAMRTLPWKWENDPSWDGIVKYSYDNDNRGKANWLRLKIKKCVSWENGQLILQGMKKDLRKTVDGERNPNYQKYAIFTKNAVYETKGYSCTDGTTADLTDRETLKTKVGQTLCKEIVMKLVGPGQAM